MAKEMCEDCGRAFDAGKQAFICPECRRERMRVAAMKRHSGTDLDGKCGSCKYSEIAENVFGKSKCYVRCTNRKHLDSREYYNRPLVAVRQRTAKACKYYEKRESGDGRI